MCEKSDNISCDRRGWVVYLLLFLIFPSFLPSFLPAFHTPSYPSMLFPSVGPRADPTQTLLSCLGQGGPSIGPLLGPLIAAESSFSKLQLRINTVGWWGRAIVQAMAASIWHRPNCHKQSALFFFFTPPPPASAPRYQRAEHTWGAKPFMGPLIWGHFEVFLKKISLSFSLSPQQQSAFWGLSINSCFKSPAINSLHLEILLIRHRR